MKQGVLFVVAVIASCLAVLGKFPIHGSIGVLVALVVIYGSLLIAGHIQGKEDDELRAQAGRDMVFCSQCGAMHPNPDALNQHMRSEHLHEPEPPDVRHRVVPDRLWS